MPSCASFIMARRPAVFGLAICVALVMAPSTTRSQDKYDPEHPVVQGMIERALAYLEANQSNNVGIRVVLGMAAYKASILTSATPKEHPFVVAAVQRIMEECTEARLAGSAEFERMYASALACIFLMEIDPDKHKNQIELMLRHIAQRQQASGAWGYRANPGRGDTSQMQYICLALWLAGEHGFRVDPEIGRRAMEWLVSTQVQGGGWIYQQPAQGGVGAPDREVRHSLVAAGLGSVYLLADWLKLAKRSSSGGLQILRRNAELDLPPSVRDITDKPDEQENPGRQGGALVRFDTSRMRNTMNQGNAWFKQRFRPDPEKFTMYYLYGFERYASLREYVDGGMDGIEDWYDKGVEYLQRSQAGDGSWTDSSTDMTTNIKTAFGILFLTRSMQITINDKARGVVRGNQGFESDTVYREVGDRLVSGGVERSLGDFFSLMDNPDEEEIERFVKSIKNLKFDEGTSKSEQLATLRMIVRHSNWQARIAAVRFLANQRDLDNVPVLLYALTDPDPRVAHQANEGLKFVSRKTSGFELSKEPNEIEIASLKARWTDWYKHVRPGATMLDN